MSRTTSRADDGSAGRPNAATASGATHDLRLVKLRKEFRSQDDPNTRVVAVDDVDLELPKGQLVTLLGPSGCGKTTLLRMIAGFEEPTSGDVFFGDRRMNQVAPNARDATMVFQSYAIFPHLNVYDNIAFGLRLKGMPRDEMRARVDRVVEQVGLTGMTQRPPSQLSGGQQQRVALARCLVMEPRMLLFDEPLSNLDAKLREQMRIEIRELQQRLGITSVYVTHDQVEAMSISDVVVVMDKGRVAQVGSPVEVYARPVDRFVADFIGKANFLEAVALGPDAIEAAGARLEVPNGVPHAAGARVTAVIRPEALTIERGEAIAAPLRGVVERASFLGQLAEIVVRAPGDALWLVDVPNAAELGMPAVGETVGLVPSPRSLHVLPR
jgi:iron(III) transport system ATP-binding protein